MRHISISNRTLPANVTGEMLEALADEQEKPMANDFPVCLQNSVHALLEQAFEDDLKELFQSYLSLKMIDKTPEVTLNDLHSAVSGRIERYNSAKGLLKTLLP